MAIRTIVFDWIGTLYERDKGPFPKSQEVLETLAIHYRMGLISLTSNISRREAEIMDSGLWKHFQYVQACTEKNASEYWKCMNKLNSLPEATLVVDDRTIRGIQIGNRLGCQTCWIEQGEHANETPNDETGNPTYSIQSIGELPALLSKSI